MSDLENDYDRGQDIENVDVNVAEQNPNQALFDAIQNAINNNKCTRINVEGVTMSNMTNMIGVCNYTFPDKAIADNKVVFVVGTKGQMGINKQGVKATIDSRFAIQTQCDEVGCELNEATTPNGTLEVGDFEYKPKGNITSISEPLNEDGKIYISVISGTGELEIWHKGNLLGVIDAPTLQEQLEGFENHASLDAYNLSLSMTHKVKFQPDEIKESDVNSLPLNAESDHDPLFACSFRQNIENLPFSYDLFTILIGLLCLSKGGKCISHLQEKTREFLEKIFKQSEKTNK